MPTFAYSARDHTGAALSGTLVADSLAQAGTDDPRRGKISHLRSSPPAPPPNPVNPAPRGPRMSRKDLIHISTQLAIMIDTGVTLSEALECIATQSEKPNVKRIVEDVCQEVQAGVDFSSALQKHSRAFPRLFVALIAASEKTGMMAKLLQRATNYLRDEHETIRRVRGALTYPAIMLGFALTTTTFLLAFVLPRFTAIYAAKKAALPVPTIILMAISNLIVTQWPLLLAGLSTLVMGTFLLLRNPAGHARFTMSNSTSRCSGRCSANFISPAACAWSAPWPAAASAWSIASKPPTICAPIPISRSFGTRSRSRSRRESNSPNRCSATRLSPGRFRRCSTAPSEAESSRR